MDSLLVELQSQIDLGDTLVENCRNILSHVSGISKFESEDSIVIADTSMA